MGHSWLGNMGRDQYWLFPGAEIVHFFGLCLLFGAVLLIDLRILGFTRAVSIKRVLSFVPVAAVGLVLNTLSGIVFLCTYPENYFPSTAFRLKVLAIALAGVNALWFQWVEAPRVEHLGDGADAGPRVKAIALLSLTAWTIVIVLGRFLPYVSKSTS
jgi:hypothetical protein